MHNQLPSGAYLISTWDGKCIQIKNGRQSIEKHDPHGHRQQQIFWIEALPEHGDDQEDGAVYSISDLTGDLFLDSAADWPSFSEKFNFKNIIAARRNGRPWQKWRIKRVEDDEHGESYNIFSLYDSAILSLKSVVVVDVHKKEVENYTQAIIKKFEAKIRAQPWEFVIPLVGVPPGWVQIRNILTGRILQQMYITSLPFLAAETTASPSLNTIMNWRLQWVFLLPENDGTSLQNSWAIRNRLTRGFLSYDNASNAGGERHVHAAETDINSKHQCLHLWKFKKQRDGFWNIVNESSGFLLVDLGAGEEHMGLECIGWKDNAGDASKWEFLL